MEWIHARPPFQPKTTLQVWLGGDVVRRVSFRPSVDYSSLFFDDCQHPEQNSYCDQKSIMAWRYVDATHPKD